MAGIKRVLSIGLPDKQSAFLWEPGKTGNDPGLVWF